MEDGGYSAYGSLDESKISMEEVVGGKKKTKKNVVGKVMFLDKQILDERRLAMGVGMMIAY